MNFPQVAALAVAAAGCATDLTARRIPNVLTFGAAAAALAFHLAVSSWSGAGWSLAGWAVGVAMFLPFFVLGGLGGGDVKLLAALGAWLGPEPTAWLALYAMLVGGPMALLVAFAHGYARKAWTNVWGLLMFWRIMGVRPHPGLTLESSTAPRLPYAVPIAAGLAVTLWWR